MFQTDEVGRHIITATNDILVKPALVGRDLPDYSLGPVETFLRDALATGSTIAAASGARAPAVVAIASTRS
jgi:hypothetical protein